MLELCRDSFRPCPPYYVYKYIIFSIETILFTNFSLSLPDKIKVTDIKWLSVWSRHVQYNFGNILFPEDLSIGYVDPTVLTCPEHEDNEEIAEVDSNWVTEFYSKAWVKKIVLAFETFCTIYYLSLQYKGILLSKTYF